MAQITEGLATIEIDIPDKISRKMEVFYNPAMKENRDITVALLKAIDKKDMIAISPLAGSGVREIRFLKELPKDAIKEFIINDHSENAYNLILKNMKLNGITLETENIKKKNRWNLRDEDAAAKVSAGDVRTEPQIKVFCEDANQCLVDNLGFDLVELDPFGSPNFFLNNSIAGLAREGILAVTATDTSSLCGTYNKTCERHYFAKPLNCYLRHEISVRIFIRKVQLIAAQFEKALTPIFSFAKEHYIRVFFLCEKQKTKTDKIIEQHKFLSFNENDGSYEWGIHENYEKEHYTLIGPMWSGELWDKSLVKKMLEILPENKMLQIISKEMNYPPLYYDTHELSRLNKCKHSPSHDGFDSTHFDKHCVKSKLSSKEFIQKFIK